MDTPTNSTVDIPKTEEVPKSEKQRRRLSLKRTNSICKVPLDIWDYWNVSPHEVTVIVDAPSSSNIQSVQSTTEQSDNNTPSYNGVKLKKVKKPKNKKQKTNESNTPCDPECILSPTMEPGNNPLIDIDKNIIDEKSNIHMENDEKNINILSNSTNQNNDLNKRDNNNIITNINDINTLNQNVPVDLYPNNTVDVNSDNKKESIEDKIDIIKKDPIETVDNNNNNNNEYNNSLEKQIIDNCKQDINNIKNESQNKSNLKKISVYVGSTVTIMGGIYFLYQHFGHGYFKHKVSTWLKQGK